MTDPQPARRWRLRTSNCSYPCLQGNEHFANGRCAGYPMRQSRAIYRTHAVNSDTCTCCRTLTLLFPVACACSVQQKAERGQIPGAEPLGRSILDLPLLLLRPASYARHVRLQDFLKYRRPDPGRDVHGEALPNNPAMVSAPDTDKLSIRSGALKIDEARGEVWEQSLSCRLHPSTKQ